MSATIEVSAGAPLRGETRVPGDKSIAHRALIFGALAHGWTRIAGLPQGADVRATMRALTDLGVPITRNGEAAVVQGRGRDALDARGATIDCANSGTTMRLLMGALAPMRGTVCLTGDPSLTKRPMRRVSEPLERLGARVHLSAGNVAPVEIEGAALRGARCDVKIASAQVKSAVILAALGASGTTRLYGELASRDHTERMLPTFGACVTRDGDALVVEGGQELRGAFVRVPGDASSAAFWIAGALMARNGDVTLRGVGLNPTRLGFVRAVQRMGAGVEVHAVGGDDEEPVGTIRARHGALRGIEIGATEVPDLLDELPLIGVLATQARGRTVVRGAAELRVKESDRIETLAAMLRALGARVETFDDGFAVEGEQTLRGATVQPAGDHRIAMAAAIAALAAEGTTTIADAGCAAVSYPEFFGTLAALRGAA